tara:strand:+ start:149 stop:397 length:249 start_codon:yes stop_codon:yes gene_type:complete
MVQETYQLQLQLFQLLLVEEDLQLQVMEMTEQQDPIQFFQQKHQQVEVEVKATLVRQLVVLEDQAVAEEIQVVLVELETHLL